MYINFFQMILSAIFPYITKLIVDDVLLSKDVYNLKKILIFTLVLVVLQIPVNIGVSYFCAKWEQNLVYNLRRFVSSPVINRVENDRRNGLLINTIVNIVM